MNFSPKLDTLNFNKLTLELCANAVVERLENFQQNRVRSYGICEGAKKVSN